MIAFFASVYAVAGACWFVLLRQGARMGALDSFLLATLWPIPAFFLLIVSSFEVLEP